MVKLLKKSTLLAQVKSLISFLITILISTQFRYFN